MNITSITILLVVFVCRGYSKPFPCVPNCTSQEFMFKCVAEPFKNGYTLVNTASTVLPRINNGERLDEYYLLDTNFLCTLKYVPTIIKTTKIKNTTTMNIISQSSTSSGDDSVPTSTVSTSSGDDSVSTSTASAP